VVTLRRLILLLGLTLVAGAVPAQAAPPAEQIARWIGDLGSDDFDARQKATEALWKAGAAAEPALEEAARSTDPEVARRAREILNKFRTGIYPDTPAAVVALVRRFQAAEPSSRRSLVGDFCKQGKPGLAAVRKLAGLEEDAETRRNLFDQIARDSGRAAGVMLADGDATAAEEVLEASLDPSQPATLRNYAAYFLLRGKVDDKARQLRSQVERTGDKKTAAVLAYLCRAKDDLASARWAAERSGDAGLVENLAEEQGDWKALLQLRGKKPESTPRPPTISGVNAMYLRLAGKTAEAEAELRGLAEQGGWPAALPLFLNDRPADAIAAFQHARQWGAAVEFLALQFRHGEAMGLAAGARPDKDEEKVSLAVARARALAGLGELEQARHELAKLGPPPAANREDSAYGMVFKAESDLGFRDLIQEQAVRVLSGPTAGRYTGSILDGLYGDRSVAALLWWGFLRDRFSKEQVATTFGRLRAVFEDHKPGPDFEALVEAEAEALARRAHERDQTAGSTEYQRDLAALAEVCQAAGKEALAQTYLEKAASLPGDGTALQRLGDVLAERGRWVQAAERYGQAWEKDRSRPLPLYLRGTALTKAGHAREGQSLQERAHLLALADDDLRYELAEALSKRGLTEAAYREFDLLARTAEFRSVYMTNVLAELTPDVISRKDYVRAALYYQRVALNVLQTGASFVDNDAYLTVPHSVHLNRARSLLAAGQLDEARPEIEACLAILPGDADVAHAAVLELTKRGRKTEADQLFSRVWSVQEKVCTAYPRCARSHNELAWLAARCRRDLDRALEHARKAVELEPKRVSFLDTLAEVYFQRGDRDKALELMKKCLEMEPKKDFYRQQLRRYEAGDPAAEVPAEG
jgi:tetratricopeptide (TPR) repeat protein